MSDVVEREGSDEIKGFNLFEATAAYLNMLGTEIDAERLLLGLPPPDGKNDVEILDRALKRIGFSVIQATSSSALTTLQTCCVSLKNGRFAIKVSHEGEIIQLVNPDNRETAISTSIDEFSRNLAPYCFYVAPSIETLTSRFGHIETETHWFWGRLLKHRVALLNVALASFFANLLAIVVSLFSMQVYDRVVPAASEATLWVLASGVAVAIVFETLLRVSRSNLIDRLGSHIEIQVSADLLSKVMGMRLGQQSMSKSNIVHMVREFGSVKEFFSTASVGVVTDLPFVLVFLFIIYGIAGSAVWIVVLGAVLIVTPSLFFQSRMSQLSREALGGSTSATRVMTEVAYGIESIKASLSQSHFQRQWEEINTLNSEKTSEQRKLAAKLTYIASATQNLSYVFTVIVGVYLVFAGEFTIGSIIAIGILSSRALAPISQLASVLMRWQNMKTALSSLDAIMSSDQDYDKHRQYLRRPRLKGRIDLRAMEYAHPGAKTSCLRVSDLCIEAGERIALIGPIGSGKSTLLRVLSGLLRVDHGEVMLDGIDVQQLDPVDVRRNVGYLPQETRLFKGSLRENLAIGTRRHTEEELYTALEFSGLGDFVRKHPEGLDIKIGDGGEGLSVGQRQSVGLARLHLQDPSIVLLDEPTAAFDQSLEREFIERLDSWIGGRTCVLATHRTPILSVLDKIALLVDGRLVKVSSAKTVLAERDNRKLQGDGKNDPIQ